MCLRAFLPGESISRRQPERTSSNEADRNLIHDLKINPACLRAMFIFSESVRHGDLQNVLAFFKSPELQAPFRHQTLHVRLSLSIVGRLFPGEDFFAVAVKLNLRGQPRLIGAPVKLRVIDGISELQHMA